MHAVELGGREEREGLGSLYAEVAVLCVNGSHRSHRRTSTSAQILKSYADYLPPFRRSVFEELLRTGGELVLHERAQDQVMT